VEGIEGSGKSTLVAGLTARMTESGIDAVPTREPGGTVLGNRLRALFVEPGLDPDPVAEAMIVNASRAQLVSEVIGPAILAGRWVVSDRYASATLAYQGFGRGVDRDVLRALADAATRGFEPDLILLVDIPTSVSRERIAARVKASGEALDRLEREDAAFHERVRRGYLELAKADSRIALIDGTESREQVLSEAWLTVRARLKLP
jgi:dTMP kinase